MGIQRIDAPGTRGDQARAHVLPGWRLTRFFADDSHGGRDGAYRLAERAETALKKRARKLKGK